MNIENSRTMKYHQDQLRKRSEVNITITPDTEEEDSDLFLDPPVPESTESEVAPPPEQNTVDGTETEPNTLESTETSTGDPPSTTRYPSQNRAQPNLYFPFFKEGGNVVITLIIYLSYIISFTLLSFSFGFY